MIDDHRYSWELTQAERIQRVKDWLKDGKIGPGELPVLLDYIERTPSEAKPKPPNLPTNARHRSRAWRCCGDGEG